MGKNQVCSSVLCVQCAAKSGASGFPVSSDTFPIFSGGQGAFRGFGSPPATVHIGSSLRHHSFPPIPDRDLSQRNFRSCGSSRLAPEAPSKFCLYPCTGPDPSHADVDPKSGITNPLPNLNLTTSFRPSKTTVAKRILVDGPLRQRHRPLDLILLHTPTATSESPARNTPPRPEPDHRRPALSGSLWWLGPSHTATFARSFSPYLAHLWR